jgi:hypothetical protein
MLMKLVNYLMKRAERKGRIFKITGTAGPDDVYLIRYFIIKSKYFNFFIHQFLRSDRDDLHDHPWDFCTYLVSGAYTENKWSSENGRVEQTRRENIPHGLCNANRLVFRKATDQHQVVVDRDLKESQKDQAATTLFFSGPTKREWGFIKTEISPVTHIDNFGRDVDLESTKRTWIKWTTYLAR